MFLGKVWRASVYIRTAVADNLAVSGGILVVPQSDWRHAMWNRLLMSCTLAFIGLFTCNAFGDGPPFSIQDVPKDGGSIAIDGKIGPGEWNGTKLEFSWTHGQTRDGGDDAELIPCDESDVCNGEPLSVSIQYAWDDTSFYYLVEETTVDDDPTTGITAGDWCHQCSNADAADTEAAPWSTDSVGFYTSGIKWTPGSEDGEFYNSFEMGPLIQPWVGLFAEEDLVIDGETQENWRRVSGSSGLNPRQLETVRQIWLWRENRARRQFSCARRFPPVPGRTRRRR